jgi:predicted DNA-binding ribbon-helix-helix protein
MPRSSSIVKRSILVGGHKTSITLEDAFWLELKKIALTEKMVIAELVTRIDGTREEGNLSSAIRLFVLRHVRNEAKLTDVAHPYIPDSPERAFSRQSSK